MKAITLFILPLVLCAAMLTGCAPAQTESSTRKQLSLAGDWQLQLDSADVGMTQQWYLHPGTQPWSDVLSLPGTTDTNAKGTLNPNHKETTHLTRRHPYTGKAWYRKEVEIPQDWQNKHITLLLERTKPTHVWIDGTPAGRNDNISTPQVYELSRLLTPGKHSIVIMVDNGKSVPEQLLSNSHAYTESTQTNWNGIIGRLQLEAREQLHIKSIQVTPDVATRTAKVRVSLSNPELIEEGSFIDISAQSRNTSKTHKAGLQSFGIDSQYDAYTLTYTLGDKAQLWSEFDPAVYDLTVSIRGIDQETVTFGLRNFGVRGTQFTINDRLTFLRGKHDACVFPLTGHTPMDVETWLAYFRTCREYGINHCRFHSWCPPRACFEAADLAGVYLQPELPFWGELKAEEEYLCNFLMKEGVNIQNEYGNHASFVMFALGNELSGSQEVMKEFVSKFRKTDNRHLYAYGSNNFLGFAGQVEGEDFLVTCRIGGAADYSTHTRGSFSFADADQGGYLNNTYPNTEMNFEGAIAGCTVPVISHETGQFQVYPNYREIEKYTGALRPDNFETFRRRLHQAGMGDLEEAFFKASGRWSALLYKADIEMDLRTKGFGGFQLLDLQDYPGQGSAYVGMLDAFMDNKGLISAEEWREFCNDVVPLFVTSKFCRTNNEMLEGEVKIANYSAHSLKNKKVKWQLKNQADQVLEDGEMTITTNESGLLDVGHIQAELSAVTTPSELTLVISIDGTNYRNRYPQWVYPHTPNEPDPGEVLIARSLTAETISTLNKGGKVLLFPQADNMKNLVVDGLFQTDYWNYRMFKGICEWLKKPVSPGTLGILTNPAHPIFNQFPTNGHTNVQWYPAIKQSHPMILDRLAASYRPIVQVIDNVERNHKLGLIFELSVAQGKLLVCMANLPAVLNKPEAKQLYISMLGYMQSDHFNPQTRLTVPELQSLFSTGVESGNIEGVRNISYED